MVSAGTAPAEEPGEEDVARAIYEAHGFAFEGRTVLADGTPYSAWAKAVSGARAILDLFAPILAEKEREIELATAKLVRAKSDVADMAEARSSLSDRALAAEAALAAERERCALIAVSEANRARRSKDTEVREAFTANKIAAAIRAQATPNQALDTRLLCRLCS